MGQGGFPAAGKPGKPEQGASVAVEAVAIGLFDAALKWKYVVFHESRPLQRSHTAPPFRLHAETFDKRDLLKKNFDIIDPNLLIIN